MSTDDIVQAVGPGDGPVVAQRRFGSDAARFEGSMSTVSTTGAQRRLKRGDTMGWMTFLVLSRGGSPSIKHAARLLAHWSLP